MQSDIVRTISEISAKYEQASAKVALGVQLTRSEMKACNELNMDQHLMSMEELVNDPVYKTDLNRGLTKEVAAKRLKENGKNELTPEDKVPEWKKFLAQMTGWFSLLLWAGSLLSFIGYALDPEEQGNLYIGIVLAIVVFLTGVFSYMQERKSSKIMEKFKDFLPKTTRVIRDGKEQTVPVDTLVLGDIVKVKYGDTVPADLRMVEVAGLKVDNASLTGESEPQTRDTEVNEENPMEATNLAFFLTAAVEGTATGIVVNCGDDTIMGRIARLVASTEQRKTPIQKEIDRFILIISTVAITLGVSFFFVGVANGTDWIANLVFMIGIIVANVPEGLLATVTVSLSLTAQRMAKKKVLVKLLDAVETLGATTTICSDKTGTLTQNIMTVAHLFYNGNLEFCDFAGTEQEQTWTYESNEFQELRRVAMLCNNAMFDEDEEAMKIPNKLDRPVAGDASETAILRFTESVMKNNDTVKDYRARNTKGEPPHVREIIFNSKNKWQLSIHQLEDDPDQLLLCIKGAPERILRMCSHVYRNGQEVPLTDDELALIEEGQNFCAEQGERILGFAEYYLPKDKYGPDYIFDMQYPYNFPGPPTVDEIADETLDVGQYTFVGFTALMDPPRDTVPDAVLKCKSAGIKVIMVTGDHPKTAKAIAKLVNIIDSDTAEDIAKSRGVELTPAVRAEAKAIVKAGWELPELTEDDWQFVLDHEQIVFARTSPQQKLFIVSHCQARHEIVAVTGDGVNDSPALKQADIGIAMGIMGSDVAKAAADMILLDDNFSSIVNGIEEGRITFDNLKKSIAYTLSSNIPEITPFLSFITFGLPLPLSTILILCVDLGTDMLPAISFAYEQAESDIMDRKPRDRNDRLVTSRLISFSYLQVGLFQALAGFYVYMIVLGAKGFKPSLLPGTGLDWSKDSNLMIAGKNFIYRDEALRTAQTAFFISIVIVQWADLLACKTRMLSLFQQGMRNRTMMAGLISETLLAIILSTVPPINLVFGSRPVHFVFWLAPMPFSLAILAYDEVRKAIIRKSPTGFVRLKSYY